MDQVPKPVDSVKRLEGALKSNDDSIGQSQRFPQLGFFSFINLFETTCIDAVGNDVNGRRQSVPLKNLFGWMTDGNDGLAVFQSPFFNSFHQPQWVPTSFIIEMSTFVGDGCIGIGDDRDFFFDC